MDDLIVVSRSSQLYDASVFAFMVFWLGGGVVLVYVHNAKKGHERAFLRGLGILSLLTIASFCVSLFLNYKVIDPIMKIALSKDQVTFVYRSGAEVGLKRGDVNSVREYQHTKSGSRGVAIMSKSGMVVKIPTAKQREVAEAVAERLGLRRSSTDGVWTEP